VKKQPVKSRNYLADEKREMGGREGLLPGWRFQRKNGLERIIYRIQGSQRGRSSWGEEGGRTKKKNLQKEKVRMVIR